MCVAGVSTAGTTGSAGNFAPGTWHLVICTPDNLGNTGEGDTGTTGAG